jgi:GNAT superfamily N-acetyltransferase
VHYEATLADGTSVLIRPIRPTDKEMLRSGFDRLSDRSRYERFFTHLDRLTDDQLRYLTEVDHHTHSAWVAISLSNDPPDGIGVVRWVRLRDQPEVAEVAVTVIDEFHKRGLGRTLLYIAGQDARAKGVRAFRAWVLGDNHATLHMLERMGATRGPWQDGVLEVTISLDDAADRVDLVPLELKAF